MTPNRRAVVADGVIGAVRGDPGVGYVARAALQPRPCHAAVLAPIDAMPVTRRIDRRRPSADLGGMGIEGDAGDSRMSAFGRRLAGRRLSHPGPMAPAILSKKQSVFGGPDKDAIRRGRVDRHLLAVGAKRIVGVHRRSRELRSPPAMSGVVASIDEAVEGHIEALGIARRHADLVYARIYRARSDRSRAWIARSRVAAIVGAMGPTHRRRKCPRGPASPFRRAKCRGRSGSRLRRPSAAAIQKRPSAYGIGMKPTGLAELQAALGSRTM